jgi:hypothetical protein
MRPLPASCDCRAAAAMRRHTPSYNEQVRYERLVEPPPPDAKGGGTAADDDAAANHTHPPRLPARMNEALPSDIAGRIDLLTKADTQLYRAALARLVADLRAAEKELLAESGTKMTLLCEEDLARVQRETAYTSHAR